MLVKTETPPKAKEGEVPAGTATATEEQPIKVEDLSPEETERLMREEPAPEGYTKAPEPAALAAAPAKEPAKPKEGEPSAAAPKPGEAPAAQPEDSFTKLERELAKPEGQEDLKDFSDRERAYFYQMRRDRKARQKAEEERDVAQRRAIQAEKKATATQPPAERKDPLAVLKGKDPTDFLTVKEVTEIIQSIAQPAPQAPKADAEAPADGEEAQPQGDPVRLRYLQMCEKEAREAHADFDAVMELADELVNNDPAQLTTVAAAVRRGENPAEAMYGLIKQHPEFAKLAPAAEIRAHAKKGKPKSEAPPAEDAATKKAEADAAEKKRREAEEAQRRLEENSGKPKTTGHLSSWEGKPVDELTGEEIEAMPDAEFRKLPRHVRQRYLRQFGSAPNIVQERG